MNAAVKTDLLNDMALFVADALGMPSSTLSRRISALEKAIGLRLLHRTTRKLELTEAGQLYFERCKRSVDEAHLAHEQLGEWLAPLIDEFARRYPGIRFEFDLTPRRVDLVSEPFDVAIRMGGSCDGRRRCGRRALASRATRRARPANTGLRHDRDAPAAGQTPALHRVSARAADSDLNFTP